ncbi:MAG: glycosyltransferase family 2 protein [Syntrophobacteraceae bacterium]
MPEIDLSIIIVNYHSSDYVLACMRSICEQTYSVNYEVIVVDNASYDGCGEELARKYPDVVFVQSEHNLGFARANNLGANHARGRVLLFLNPDTEIQERAIERLYGHFLQLVNPGMAGCRLLNSDGSLQTSCVQSLPTILNQVLDADILRRVFPKSGLWGTEALLEKAPMPVEVEAVSGACMIVRREVFDSIGGFSGDFFMYGEDLDLCWKARRAGFRNYHINDVVIVHHGGGSLQQVRSNFSIVMMRESVSRFLRKSNGSFYSFCYRLALTGAALCRLVFMAMLFPAYAVRCRAKALNAPFRKWFAILRWGFGLERWTRRYGVLQPAGICPKTAG